MFYRPHPYAEKLPLNPKPLPLLVFVHGLGGSLAQFYPLLKSLVNLAPCLGIDLPGCGMSSFSPRMWKAYTTLALIELIATVVEDFRDAAAGQGVVFIGHSMGCTLSVLLASPTSPWPHNLAKHVQGMVAISPRVTALSHEQVQAVRRLLWVPGPIFDLWRRWDRRGGIDSASVARFAGKNADRETRELQLRFNEQSKTGVWRRMVSGLIESYTQDGVAGRLSGPEVWAGLDTPVLLVGGEDDLVTKPEEVQKIAMILGGEDLTAGKDEGHSNIDSKDGFVQGYNPLPQDSTEQSVNPQQISHHPRKGGKCVKAVVLPSPAAHSLLYAPISARTLAGILSDFLAWHVCPRLSLGWQLQHLSTEGKWDVKNIAKWKAVAPVSEPIAGVFLALKTLREVDEEHCPEVFVRNWRGRVKQLIDISYESPVYDPRGLEKGGIAYHKFSTVSKIPPTAEEVKDFVSLVDSLRTNERGSRAIENPEKKTDTSESLVSDEDGLIGVHCHYGFNRTGFFVVCYMVERLGYDVQSAIDEFGKRRAPGIRHEHFIDTLFVRYYLASRGAV